MQDSDADALEDAGLQATPTASVRPEHGEDEVLQENVMLTVISGLLIVRSAENVFQGVASSGSKQL